MEGFDFSRYDDAADEVGILEQMESLAALVGGERLHTYLVAALYVRSLELRVSPRSLCEILFGLLPADDEWTRAHHQLAMRTLHRCPGCGETDHDPEEDTD